MATRAVRRFTCWGTGPIAGLRGLLGPKVGRSLRAERVLTGTHNPGKEQGLGWGFLSGELTLSPRTPDLDIHHHPSTAPPGSVYPQLLIPLLPLLGAGLVLGLGALGVVWWRCR